MQKNPTVPANDEVSKGIRKYQNILMVSAAGVMVLGLWSVIKAAMLTLYSSENNPDAENLMNNVDQFFDSLDGHIVIGIIILAIMILIILGVILSVRFYIYINARREGWGGRSGNLYLVLTFILLLISSSSVVLILYSGYKGDRSLEDTFVNSILELTSLSALYELLHSAVKIRKLRKHE